MELRPHQTLAIQKTRESFASGKKHICLCCSVASGKTLIAKNIIDCIKNSDCISKGEN